MLHTHAVIFNATWDNTEGQWKAVQPREMFKALTYADAVYNTEMTRELGRLGYDIHQVGKASEITGVTREMIEQFSKRRIHIEQRLAEELKNPSNAGVDAHTLRERISGWVSGGVQLSFLQLPTEVGRPLRGRRMAGG